MDDDYSNDRELDMIELMDEARKKRFDLMLRVNDRYIPTRRDKNVKTAIEFWIDETLAALRGDHPEGRVLAITGESGAGKTWSVERAIKKVPGLEGNLLSILTPRPCSLKQLGLTFLRAMNYNMERRTDPPDHIIWQKVREQLHANRIRFVWIDELQHVFTGATEDQLQVISDTLKNSVQQREWPVSFLISGLPLVSTFLGRDRQIERRSRTLEFGGLAFPAQTELVRHVMTTVIQDHAEMRVGAFLTDEFIGRMCHAAQGQFGVLASLTRAAIFNALERKDFDGTVQNIDFAVAYAAERNCEASQNIFTAKNWDKIQPANSRQRDIDAPPGDDGSTKKKRKN